MKVKRLSTPVLSLLLTVAFLILSFSGVLPAGSIYAAETGTTYYVDSVEGNDGNNGTSESTPWKTLAKISGFSGFKPGDKILLKAGSVWNESLDLKCSGDENNQIIVGKYGDSDLKPVINGGGGKFAIRMENISYVTLQDIEITNFNAANPDDYKTEYHRRSGVWVIGHHNGPIRGIQLKNLDIHHINGMSLTGEEGVSVDGDAWVNKNHNAAILVNAWSWENPDPAPAYFVDLLIENNYIHDIATIGINIDGHQNDKSIYHKNVIIRNNTIIKTGADAIVVGVAENPLVEHNIGYDAGINGHNYKWIAGMWSWKTNGAVFQYNEVARVHYETKDTADSAAFDTDILTEGDHIFQYNYSHENEGGFMMNMGQLKNGINIVRYNISQNDKHNGFTGNTLNISDPCLFYNNVFYNDKGDGILIEDNPDATFINNIFYTKGGNQPYSESLKFYNNSFYGHLAPIQGVNNIVGDPGFVNPGQGRDGIGTVEGYRLKPDSPLIGVGKLIEDNGGKDFWGNALYKGSPDIGAFEDPTSTISDTTSPAAPTMLKVVDKTDTTVKLSWNAVENNVMLDGDIYDASTGTKLASVVMSNSCTITGLEPETEYGFYVIARDLSGNRSQKSDTVTVKTSIRSIVVDNGEAQTTGSFVEESGSSAKFGDNYVKASPGDGSGSVIWRPTIPKDGYYSVYYWLPDGSADRASNAPFTVYFDGGSKAYEVNEKVKGGQWVLLGIHKFKAGTEGYVQLTDNADGEVVGDAIKFAYNEGFGTDSITSIELNIERMQLRVGETAKLTVFGVDGNGKKVDLEADGISVNYISDNNAIASVENSIVTGNSNGKASLTATVTISGTKFTSNSVEVFVGPGFIVEKPKFTDPSGNSLTSLTPYGVVKASARVINSTEEKRKASLIVALYSLKGLVKVESQDVVINQYDNFTLSVQLALPEDVRGCYVKAFVWDGLASLHPLTDVTVFPD